MSKPQIIVGRCVRNSEPITCTGLCNTVSCPYPVWMALTMTDTWRCSCGYDMPKELTRCIKCGGAKPGK